MGRASNAQYRKAARLHFGGMSQWESLMKSKCYTSEQAAKANGHKLFKRDGTGQNELIAEFERLEKIEFDEAVLSKKEKLEANAHLSRGLFEKAQAQLEDEEGEVDHKLLDSFNKIGKRDDVLQGHQIMAETNPIDKKDQMIADWMMEAMQANEEKRADIVDI